MERAGAARCFSEAGRHCWEAAATTTAAVTGTAPGVSIGDTGPCGTGSAGPVRWEGRVTSREGGLRRRRWCEAPFLLRAGSSNCGRTCGPRKRTTSRGRRSTAAGTQRVTARLPGPSPGPRSPSAPGAQPPPFPPPAVRRGLCRPPQPSPAAARVGPATADSVFSISVSAAPYGDSPCPSSGVGTGCCSPFISLRFRSLAHSADTYFGSSLILLPVVSHPSAPSPPPAWCSMLLVLCTFYKRSSDVFANVLSIGISLWDREIEDVLSTWPNENTEM